MDGPSISKLLAGRGVSVKPSGFNAAETARRGELTRKIADAYTVFEQVRDRVFHATDAFMKHVEIVPGALPQEGHDFLSDMLTLGLVRKEEHGHEICELVGKRYLSGGWLEELAWLAAHESGAHEALYGQCVSWTVNGYAGENEIDLIMRRHDSLSFVSCKALRSMLDGQDRKHRARLMDAVQEADNLADHFGRPGEKVAVLVTTDLFDEIKGTPRYSALLGKAAVLDVRIIPLEELKWDRLVSALTGLWGQA
jgi:hypothetical protein